MATLFVRFFFTASLAGLLLGCSNPKTTVVPTDLAAMANIQPQIAKLAPEEKELFAGYVMRHTLGASMGKAFGMAEGPIPEGVTVGQAIDEQRQEIANIHAKEAAEKELREKVKAEREKSMDIMRKAVTVAIVGKKIDTDTGYSGIVLDERITVTVAYKNTSGKDIAGIKGTVDVADLFGDELSGFNISFDKTIKAGDTATYSGGRSIKYGPNSEKDRKFASLPDDKFKVTWNPAMIVFEDGSKVVAPESP